MNQLTETKGYNPVTLKQVNQPRYVEGACEAINIIARAIIFIGINVDHNYPPNIERYFSFNNSCCSKLLRSAGFYQQFSYSQLSLSHVKAIDNLQILAKDRIEILLKPIHKSQEIERNVHCLKGYLNELINHQAGDSLTMCMTLVLYLYQEGKIEDSDKVEFVFLENMNAKDFFQNGDYHLDHYIVKINGWYFDPLTGTCYDENESNKITNQFENNDDKVKLKGLNDVYKLKEVILFDKGQYVNLTELKIKFY